MDLKNNFASLVCLGQFNPGILTPDFLSKVCNLQFNQKPQGQRTPIFSSVDYGNVMFIVELDKMQIMEKEVENFRDTKIVGYFEKYIAVLQYTPVIAYGINFNTIISSFDIEVVNLNLNNREKLLAVFDTDSFLVEKKQIVTKNGMDKWLTHTFQFNDKMNDILRVFIQKTNSTITLNFNFEVTDIEQNREKLRLIGGKLEQLVSFNSELIQKLIGKA